MKKIALITGGNSGIGYETAKLLKEKGYIVYIVGRDERRINEAANDLGCSAIVADLADNRAATHIASYFTNGLDVLVNNAALARFIPLEAFTDNDYEAFFTTNLKTPIELIRLLTPALAERQGCIVNVSSIVVNNGLANAGLYAATKGGLEAFTRSMAVELATRKIRINCVAPGATDTPLLHKIGIPADVLASIRKGQEALIPLRRYGKPEEIAHVIIAQIESTYTTGTTWVVDGGMSAI